MGADNLVEVRRDEALTHGPLMHRCSGKRSRDGELRPVRPYVDSKFDRAQNCVNRVARKAHDKKRERGNVILPANPNFFDEFRLQDWLPMDALLNLGIRALDAEIDTGASGPSHDLDCRFVETV